MKISSVAFPCLCSALLWAVTWVSAQSVADAARAQRGKRDQKSAGSKKVYTNDDLGQSLPSQGEQPSPAQLSSECNEASAMIALRVLYAAQLFYASSYKRGFSKGLNQLGRPSGRAENMEDVYLVDPVMAGLSQGGTDTSFEKAGYRFTYTPGSSDAAGRIEAYTISARPMRYGQSGKLSFFTDQRGLIHATQQDRAATASDPPGSQPSCKPSETKSSSPQGNRSTGRSKKELESAAALILLQMAEIESTGHRLPIYGRVVKADVDVLRSELEKIRKAAQEQGFDIQVQEGSVEEKRRKAYSLMSDQERDGYAKTLEKHISDLEESLRNDCGPGKPTQGCDGLRSKLDDTRARLLFLRKTH